MIMFIYNFTLNPQQIMFIAERNDGGSTVKIDTIRVVEKSPSGKNLDSIGQTKM